MLQIEITLVGSKRKLQQLTKLGRSMNDFRPAFKRIGDQAVDYISGPGFASQGGVYGDRWPRLSTRYAARKAKRYPGKGILVATGSMRDSFRSKAGRMEATIDNTAPQFKYHQSSAPRTVMPRRKMMGINNPLKQIVKREIKAEMKRKLIQAGAR